MLRLLRTRDPHRFYKKAFRAQLRSIALFLGAMFLTAAVARADFLSQGSVIGSKTSLVGDLNHFFQAGSQLQKLGSTPNSILAFPEGIPVGPIQSYALSSQLGEQLVSFVDHPLPQFTQGAEAKSFPVLDASFQFQTPEPLVQALSAAQKL